MKAPAFWSLPQPTRLARLLRPLGAIYGRQTLRRMALPGRRVAVPVICVGNFTLGGAGKTPAAIAIGKTLLAMGERVAFVSRGYGGAARAEPVVVDLAMHGARLVGDEPLLLARVAACYVGGDRLAGALAAIEAGASVVVMDDGLQNPRIAKDLSFAAIDVEFGFGNGLCFPAGPLRAPVAAQLLYVTAAILIGEAPAPALFAGAPAFTARLRPDGQAAARLLGQRVVAFAGIARPPKFYATLAAMGARIVGTRDFPDHHPFATHEIDALRAQALALDAQLVTTEKDWVRLDREQRRGVFVAPVELVFDDAGELARLLGAALAARRSR